MMWTQLMPVQYQIGHAQLALAWSKAKQEVLLNYVSPLEFPPDDVKILWKKVTGPLSNMVASLYMFGWNPVSFSEWHAPDGSVWSVPTQKNFHYSPAHLARALQDSIAQKL